VSDRDRDFTRYVEARGGALLRTAVFLCAGDRSGAEDLVQSTLVRAYVAWHRVRDEAARDGYVRRIMVRESYRRPARSLAVLGEPGLLDAHGPVEDRLDLFPLLAALPRQQRAVVVLRYYEDLSERDIADALGCSPGSVKRHASRALATLRGRLSPDPTRGEAHARRD
jgi:RNA polymerase sigma-70 factor (sigma-E family)